MKKKILVNEAELVRLIERMVSDATKSKATTNKKSINTKKRGK